MNKYIKISAIVAVVSVISGCATSTHNYTKPAKQYTAIRNSIEISDTFDNVWDNTIKNLSSAFYVINNVDKTSRIINVSFSTDTPSQFIDCGIVTSNFSYGRLTENIIYKASDSASHLFAPPEGHIGFLKATKQKELTGRANLVITPNTYNTKTTLTVNAKYVLINDVSISNPLHNIHIGNKKYTYNFSTNSPLDEQDFYCKTNSVLESELLQMYNIN